MRQERPTTKNRSALTDSLIVGLALAMVVMGVVAIGRSVDELSPQTMVATPAILRVVVVGDESHQTPTPIPVCKIHMQAGTICRTAVTPTPLPMCPLRTDAPCEHPGAEEFARRLGKLSQPTPTSALR